MTPSTPFLRHSLLLDGKTTGELIARRFSTEARRYADTLTNYPPQRVSIAEFEADMRAARAGESANGR